MNIELRDLRYFETIAELCHLGRASEVLHRSQPALTKCVQRIEHEVGAPLFERAGRGLKLTPVGTELLARARKLREANEHYLGSLSDFVRGDVGTVRLGCGSITADYLLPAMCKLILKHIPGISLEVMVGTNYFLKEQVLEGKLDMIAGVVSADDEELVSQGLIEDTVVAAASHGHPIFEQPDIELADLLRYQWILPTRHVASRRWLDQAFRSHGLALPVPSVEANVLPSLHEVIESTNLLCFLSRLTLRHPKVRGLLREIALPATTMSRQLGISYPRGSRSPACARVISLLDHVEVEMSAL